MESELEATTESQSLPVECIVLRIEKPCTLIFKGDRLYALLTDEAAVVEAAQQLHAAAGQAA